jgi:acetoin utilization protein AcuB
MFVRDWMTSPVTSIAPEERLFAALKRMNDKHIRRLPVLAGKKLVGIITRSDIYSALGPVERWGTVKEGEEPTVDDFMTPKPLSVSAKEPLETAAVLMHDNRISGLPVTDGERLVGIITETDIFKAMLDIMGVKEGGARIVIQLASPQHLLAEIAKATSGLAVRSVVTYRGSASWHAVVRVRGRETSPSAKSP